MTLTLHEFQILASRTLNLLGDPLKDSIHMTEGMASEFMEEFIMAIMDGDKVNIAEEFADIQWYAVLYADMHNIPMALSSVRKEDLLGFGVYIGQLCNYDKRNLAYHKDTDPAQRNLTLNNLLASMEEWATQNGIDSGRARYLVIEKLKHRYPEKFSREDALNRDTVGERAILEGDKPCS